MPSVGKLCMHSARAVMVYIAYRIAVRVDVVIDKRAAVLVCMAYQAVSVFSPYNTQRVGLTHSLKQLSHNVDFYIARIPYRSGNCNY